MIQLHGLTRKQKALCDILWQFPDRPAVERFIASLPKRDQQEAESLVECMILATIDDCELTLQDCGESRYEIDRIMNL